MEWVSDDKDREGDAEVIQKGDHKQSRGMSIPNPIT